MKYDKKGIIQIKIILEIKSPFFSIDCWGTAVFFEMSAAFQPIQLKKTA